MQEAARCKEVACYEVLSAYEVSGKVGPEITEKVGSAGSVSGLNTQYGAMSYDDKLPETFSPLGASTALKSKGQNGTELVSAEDRATIGALCSAAAKNNVESIHRILKKDNSMGNGADYDARTALHAAAAEGNGHAVEALLHYPTVAVNCLDRWKQSPLSEAIRNGHFEVAKQLRDAGATVINEQLAFKLCASAAEGDLQTFLKYYASGHSVDVGDYDARTPLHLAACENKLGVATWLLETAGVNFTP